MEKPGPEIQLAQLRSISDLPHKRRQSRQPTALALPIHDLRFTIYYFN
jgi:hypothetical protein